MFIASLTGEVAVFTADPPMAAGVLPVGPEARHLATSMDGRWLAIAHRDSVSILDTQTMDALVDLKAGPRAPSMAFHPNSRSLWVANPENRRLITCRTSLHVERDFDQQRGGDHSIILRVPAPDSAGEFGSTPPLKLLVEVPARLAEVDVPFEFRDLPLPPHPDAVPKR